MNRRLFLRYAVCGPLGLLAGCAATQQKPLRRFILRFQWEDFVVPQGVTWKLTWRSPYARGEITPGYDVRIISGEARIGERGEMFASAYDSRPDQNGLLDLQTVSGRDVTICLDAGTRFTLANGRVELRVREYTRPSKGVLG